MNLLTKISLIVSTLLLLVFLTTQSLVVFHFIDYVDSIGYIAHRAPNADAPGQ